MSVYTAWTVCTAANKVVHCYYRCSLGEKLRHCKAELSRHRLRCQDGESAARVATHAADALRAELSAVKQSHDKLDTDLQQAHQQLKERTDSLIQCFDQSVALEVRSFFLILLHSQRCIISEHGFLVDINLWTKLDFWLMRPCKSVKIIFLRHDKAIWC